MTAEAQSGERPPSLGRPVGPFRHVADFAPGAVLLLHAVLLQQLSEGLSRGSLDEAFARQSLVASSVLAGLVYLSGTWVSTRREAPSTVLSWAVLCACLSRAIVMAAPPMLETDYQRYLWDGAVTASGVNPYRHTPSQVLLGGDLGADAEVLGSLSIRSGRVLGAINHPHLTTIYPPLAQAFFAVAAKLDEFGVDALRAVYLVSDALAALILAAWLRTLRLPASRLLWYVANPLVLREVYSAAHMDVLVLPFVVAAAWAGARSRPLLAGSLAVAATAVKVWPALLLPLWLPAMRARGARRLLAAGAWLSALALALWWPVLSGPANRANGFLSYGESWQNNDGLFRSGIWLCERVLESLALPPWHSHVVLRALVSLLLAALVLRVVRRLPEGAGPTARDLSCLVSALFLLSPTQFPWYWVWCLPFLAASPNLPLLAYTALLPLYELQDRWPWVVWVEHLPVWIGLALLAIRSRAGALARPTAP